MYELHNKTQAWLTAGDRVFRHFSREVRQSKQLLRISRGSDGEAVCHLSRNRRENTNFEAFCDLLQQFATLYGIINTLVMP